MSNLRTYISFFLALSLLLPLSASSHHSFEMFDRNNPMQISGEVREFQWVNPHSWIQLLVTDEASNEIVEWSIEGRSPNVLVRRGWTRNTLQAGEKVTLTIYPLKNGDYYG